MAAALGTPQWAEVSGSFPDGIDGATAQATITWSAGNAFLVVAETDSYSGETDPNITITDAASSTFTPIGTLVTEGTNGSRLFAWVCQTPSGSPGSRVITATASEGNASELLLMAVPITGGATSGIVVAFGNGTAPGQFQATPTTGANLVTSGTAQTPSGYNALVVGFGFDAGGTGAPTVGTGFTSIGTGWLSPAHARLATKTISSGTAQALFTALANESHLTLMVALLEAVAAPVLSSTTPTDGATGVSTGTTLAATFDQNVSVGTGNVRIVKDEAPVSAPSVITRNTDAQQTNATSFVIDIPGAGSIVSGDLCIIAVSKDDNEAPTGTWPPTGWNIGQSDATGTTNWGGWIYRWCDGSTDGTTVTLDESSENWISRGWHIRGADTGTNPLGGTVATGTSTSSNPPSVTNPGGTEPHLILYYVAIDGNSTFSAHPGGYTNTGSNTTTDATTGNRCAQAYGELASDTSGSEDPGALTNTSNAWKAFTIAIRPKYTRTTVETIAITSGQVGFSSATVTITPTGGTLVALTDYHVEIDSGAILASDDSAPYGGISAVTTWNFTTGAAAGSDGGWPSAARRQLRVNPSYRMAPAEASP